MYERIQDILRLGRLLQASYSGLSIGDIEREFGVSRRTAERMRDAVLASFPGVEEIPGDANSKRWRISRQSNATSLNISAQDLSVMHAACDVLANAGRPDDAKTLRKLAETITASLKAPTLARIEPDLELLMEAEGLAMRAGPRPAIDGTLLPLLRRALLAQSVIEARYHPRTTGHPKRITLEPLGLLFGSRHYLVALHHGRPSRTPKLFALNALNDVRPTGESYSRPEGFSLASFAQRSFGVFQGEPIEAEVVFSSRAARDALDHHFHVTQEKHQREDGSLIVRFKASGPMEIAWHLFTWSPEIVSIAPETLRSYYLDLVQSAAESLVPSRSQNRPATRNR